MTAVQPDYTSEPCRSCHAPVIWAVTSAGKSMPVDRDPAEDGSIALQWRERASGLLREHGLFADEAIRLLEIDGEA